MQPVTTGPRQRARGPASSTLAERSARPLRAAFSVVRSEYRSTLAVIALLAPAKEQQHTVQRDQYAV